MHRRPDDPERDQAQSDPVGLGGQDLEPGVAEGPATGRRPSGHGRRHQGERQRPSIGEQVARIGEQGERVSDQARDDLSDQQCKHEAESDGQGAAIRGQAM